MKKCSTCKEQKTLDSFNKNSRSPDGHSRECRECKKAGALRRKLANPEEYRRRQQECDKRSYYKHIEKRRKKSREWNRANPERRAENERRYRALDPIRSSSIIKRYQVSNPHVMAAHAAVKAGVRHGLLRKHPCWVCGAQKVEAHHSSYAEDMRLDVVWLCHKHHLECHREYE